jgi:molecular chaperone GrpE (heat shock protein)
MTTTKKRAYRRRSEDEQIAELEAKIREIEERKKRREVKESPLAKDFSRFKKHLTKFSQSCVDHGRNDVANSVLGLMNTIERQILED